MVFLGVLMIYGKQKMLTKNNEKIELLRPVPAFSSFDSFSLGSPLGL